MTLRLLTAAAPLVAELGRQWLSCRGSLARWLWDLPGAGVKPVPRALTGGFLTSGPVEKS